MRCSKAQLNISAALDGELDQASRAGLVRHLEDCPGCLRYQEDLEQCRVLLRESEAAPSAQFEWKVQLGIAKALRERASSHETARAGRFWLPAGVSAVATAGLVLAVGLWWLGAQGPVGSGSAGNSGGFLTASSPIAGSTFSNTPLRALEQESPFRPRVVNTMPQWGRQARPDWRTPPSLQGQVFTVNDLRLGFRSHYHAIDSGPDSTAVLLPPAKGR